MFEDRRGRAQGGRRQLWAMGKPPRLRAMAVGIIGLGRLGGSLARGLVRAGVGEICVFNRTVERAHQLAAEVSGVAVLESATEVLQRCDPVFVWMDPADAAEVLSANVEVLQLQRPLIVTCAPGLSPGKYSQRWADTLPNVNLATGQGVTLVSWGPALDEAERESVLAPLRACGAVYEVPEQDLGFYSALASNGPAFYAQIMEVWADALAQRHGYDRQLCRRMVRQTMAGTVALQDQDDIDAAEVIRRVAHPGASTEKGLAALNQGFAAIAEAMLRSMDKW